MSSSRIIRNFFIIVFCIVLIGWFLITIKQHFSPSIRINLNEAAVIKQVQSLNRLETASYTIEKVIDAGTSGNAFEQFLIGDKILLIAHGQVIAGFDLSKITKTDIAISGKNISLTLPPPEILSASLDESQTRVYDRRHGLLNPGDKDLESKVRQAAQASIRDAACKGKILDEARNNGKKQLEGLLKALGFEQVTLIIPTGSC